MVGRRWGTLDLVCSAVHSHVSAACKVLPRQGPGPDPLGGSFLTCPLHGSAIFANYWSLDISIGNQQRLNIDRSVITERVQFVPVQDLCLAGLHCICRIYLP